jgi:hypothetical protein
MTAAAVEQTPPPAVPLRLVDPTFNPVDPFGPFDRDEFQSDIAELADLARDNSVRWAHECRVIARLAAQVPRSAFDTRGATPWTSFVREIAVARRCSDQAAANDIHIAVALVAVHPRTLALLEAGAIPQYNARTLVAECAGMDREAIAAVEEEVAERACRLSPSKIRDAVRKIELRYDGDAAASRAATAARSRGMKVLAQPDGQADLILSGPALLVVQAYERLSADAKAAKADGDDRGLGALRFDLGMECLTASAPADDEPAAEPADAAVADHPVPGAPAMTADRRFSRPIRVNIQLPVTTALGLGNEPGWLDGDGWISAPQCREWLTLAELRQVCVTPTGQVADVSDRIVRPDPAPEGIRTALLRMVEQPGEISPKTYEEQPHYVPSEALAEFVELRDVYCDGPTGRRVPATRSDKDHEKPYPAGPTAAWNLVDRARRTHLLKHRGWTPLRTATSTIWFSPAGQAVEVEHWTSPPPDIDPDAELPDPNELQAIDAELVRVPSADDDPPF